MNTALIIALLAIDLAAASPKVDTPTPPPTIERVR